MGCRFIYEAFIYLLVKASFRYSCLKCLQQISHTNNVCRLYGNPICNDTLAQSHRKKFNGTDANVTLPIPNISLLNSCTSETCDTANNQELVYGLYVLRTCQRTYPLWVGYRLKSLGFAIFSPSIEWFRQYLSLGLNLWVHAEWNPERTSKLWVFKSTEWNVYILLSTIMLYTTLFDDVTRHFLMIHLNIFITF